jgi:hypothetical protein
MFYTLRIDRVRSTLDRKVGKSEARYPSPSQTALPQGLTHVLTIEPQRAECPNALSSHRELLVTFQDTDDDDVHAIVLAQGQSVFGGHRLIR